MTLGLIIDDLRVFLVSVEIIGACRVLQLGNRIRRPHVLFTADTECVFTTGVQRIRQHGIVTESKLM